MAMSFVLGPWIRSRHGYAIAVVLTATAFAAAGPAAADATPTSPGGGDGRSGSKPTVVLVHGKFADASGRNGVIERLQQDGSTVVAPANPIRGLAGDSAYIASFLKSIQGPIVLVGHSYGGAVISAAAGNPAADLPTTTAAVMAAGQRPISATAFMDKATAAAWRTIPSWSLVATQDKAIAPDLERFEAKPPLAGSGSRSRDLTAVGGIAVATVLAGAGLVAVTRKRRNSKR